MLAFRRRSLIYKFLCLIPLCWLIFVVVEFRRTEPIPVLVRVTHGARQQAPMNGPDVDAAANLVNVDGDGHNGKGKGKDQNPAQSNEELGVGVLPVPEERPGEMGKPFKPQNLTKAQKQLVSEGWKKNAFNQFVSDLISVKR